jgi:hypothetical protein
MSGLPIETNGMNNIMMIDNGDLHCPYETSAPEESHGPCLLAIAHTVGESMIGT